MFENISSIRTYLQTCLMRFQFFEHIKIFFDPVSHVQSSLFSLFWLTGPFESLSCNVCLCVSVSPIYKCHKSNRSIAKGFLREKFGKDIGLRFSNLGSELVENRRLEKQFIFCLFHSL